MIKKLTLMCLTALMLCGCMGTMALSGKAKQANLSITEHRWGREGIFLGFHIIWIYRISAVLDLLLFNSIEFWSGENPINGKKPLVDLPMSAVNKMGVKDVDMAQIQRLNENQAKLYITFNDGNRVSFDVDRTDSDYTVSYLGKEFFKGKVTQ